MLMMLFICGLVWAFWANSERYVQRFKSESRITDDAGLLDSSQTREVARLLSTAESKYGVLIHIKVSRMPIISADARPGAILLGICPSIGQTALLMPESWQQTLGDGFVIRLKDEVMARAFENGKPAEGLISVLKLLNERFEELSSGTLNPTELPEGMAQDLN